MRRFLKEIGLGVSTDIGDYKVGVKNRREMVPITRIRKQTKTVDGRLRSCLALDIKGLE